MAWAIAPMLGPKVGGILDTLFGWRASFLAFVLVGLLVLTLCWVDLGETNHNRSETIHKQFLSDRALLGSRLFWGYSACKAFSLGAFYAFLGGAPLVATAVFAVSPAELGFYIGSITAGFVFGSYLAGRFSKQYEPAMMMIAGRLIACIGLTVGVGIIVIGVTNAWTFFGACMFVGIGNGVTLPSSNAGVMSVNPKLAGSASGLSGALALAGGAMISGIAGSILTPSNGAYALLGLMLASSSIGLIAAVYVRRMELSF